MKVKYKKIPENLKKMAKPSEEKDHRSSLSQSITITEHYELDVERLIPFSKQARVNFNDDEIKNLAKSIALHGVRQPLTVIQSTNFLGKYEVVSGERRLRAATLAGLKKVPCIMISDQSLAEEIAVIENIMREDLHPLELSKAFHSLISSNEKTTQIEMAERIGVSPKVFSETLKYYYIPEEVKKLILLHDIRERDFLRKVSKSKTPLTIVNIKIIQSAKSKKQMNKSILRVLSKDGEIQIQSKGLANLSDEQKKILKEDIITLLS
jgi:ParB family chromosome partitioning protein